MAKTVTKTSINPKTGTTTKTTKSSGKMTGTQQYRLEKIKAKKALSNTGAAVAIAGELATTLTGVAAENRRAREAEAKARAESYKAALAKWNGILSSTPQAAEGTDEGQTGEGTGENSTGNSQWQGW